MDGWIERSKIELKKKTHTTQGQKHLFEIIIFICIIRKIIIIKKKLAEHFLFGSYKNITLVRLLKNGTALKSSYKRFIANDMHESSKRNAITVRLTFFASSETFSSSELRILLIPLFPPSLLCPFFY